MSEIKDCCSCIYETRSTFTEPCVSCGFNFQNYVAKPTPKRKRKTHADFVRSMSDEELAQWLYWGADGAGFTRGQWLEWLKQEAET